MLEFIGADSGFEIGWGLRFSLKFRQGGKGMKNQVFFADLKVTAGKGLLDKLDALLHRTDLKAKIRERDLVAIKLHFGEKGNTTFIRPLFLRRVVEQVKRYRGKPFLTDTNTLYTGSRSEAISHLTTAYQHGFAYSVIDAPILIADGLRGNSAIKVQIDQPIFKTVSIAHDVFMADALVCVTHFKGHELVRNSGRLKKPRNGLCEPRGKAEPAFQYFSQGQREGLLEL